MANFTQPGMRSEAYGELQHLVDNLYKRNPSGTVTKVDVLIQAEVDDLEEDLQEVIELIPSGTYVRARLCDQINSIVTAHGWVLPTALSSSSKLPLCCSCDACKTLQYVQRVGPRLQKQTMQQEQLL